MQQVVCIQAHGDQVPGDLVEIPDGAECSPVHFAEPGSPEAETAVAEGARIAAAKAKAATGSTPPAKPPVTPPAILTAPDAPDAAGGAK